MTDTIWVTFNENGTPQTVGATEDAAKRGTISPHFPDFAMRKGRTCVEISPAKVRAEGFEQGRKGMRHEFSVR